MLKAEPLQGDVEPADKSSEPADLLLQAGGRALLLVQLRRHPAVPALAGQLLGAQSEQQPLRVRALGGQVRQDDRDQRLNLSINGLALKSSFVFIFENGTLLDTVCYHSHSYKAVCG